MSLKHRVGIRIKTFRSERKLSQQALAEMIDRSVHAVSAIERGKSLPNFETLEKLAAALNTPIRDFFDEPGLDETGKRAAYVARLRDMIRQLDDEELELAVRLISQVRGD